MGHVLLHALEDSLIVLAFLVPINILIALLEPRLAGRIKLKGALAPLVGVTVGLFPQCGFSVVATDLYKKRHITIGTLLGVYLATSDEALPIFLASGERTPFSPKTKKGSPNISPNATTNPKCTSAAAGTR